MSTQPLGISRPPGEAAPAAGAGIGASLPNESKTGEIEQIMPEVYEELRRLAAAYLRGERAEHTLQSTALVHEAYLRLRDQRELEWKNPPHFIGIFARIMRETLTNYAVAKKRLKRGGEERLQLTLEFYESQKN